MPITIYPTTFKYKDNNGEYQSINAIKGDPGEVTQAELSSELDDKAPVITSSASGSIVQIEDGADGMPVKNLMVQIEPVQDLHGYDHPWPAGGGKNLFDKALFPNGTKNRVAVTETNTGFKLVCTSSSGNYASVEVQDAIDYATISGKTVTFSLDVSVGENAQGRFRFDIFDDNGSRVQAIKEQAFSTSLTGYTFTTTIPTEVADAKYIGFTFYCTHYDAEGLTVEYSNVQLEVGSTATAWTPYSNICPISGWDAVKVTRTGKNLLPCSGLTQTTNGITWTVDRDENGNVLSITADGTATGNSDFYFVGGGRIYEPIEVKNGKYVLTLLYNGNIAPFVVRSDGQFMATQQNKQFDLDASEKYRIFVRVNSGTTLEDAVLYPMIRFASESSTDYEPYSGQTYSITLPSSVGTVYGGELTINEDGTGKLKVEKAKYIANANKLVNFYNGTSTTGAGYALDEKAVEYTVSSVYPDAISSICKTLLQIYWAVGHSAAGLKSRCDNETVNYSAFSINGGYLTIYDPDNAISEADFKEKYNSAEFVYQLETPVEYQLTTEQVATLLGQNNVWADAGDVSVSYRADTKLYSDSHVARVQDVQVNGTSVLSNGVANVPMASISTFGVVRVNPNMGVSVNTSGGNIGTLNLVASASNTIKSGANAYSAIAPIRQHESTFYGLAKAAGDSTQSASSNAVGAYTETAKSKIHTMLNGSVAVSGTTPTITGQDGIRYVCGEVSTISITPPASGIIDVVFDSGTTPAVLTIVGNVRWANGFDPTTLDANTTYEINILDGLGVAGKWT